MRMGSGAVPVGCGQLILTSHPSPNFGPRRDSARPDMVVIHYTAMAASKAALKTLCDPITEVSAHYLISTAGEVFSLVAEDQRAWHAGAGQWGATNDVNSRSIGIELTNSGYTPFANRQIDALEELLRGILERWSIPPERVIGHSDMAPGRKIDPGVRFDWARLALSGLSVWPQPTDNSSDFREGMTRFGYTSPQNDDQLLQSFRRRFRPGATGPLDDVDRAMITDLATRFPVDANQTWV